MKELQVVIAELQLIGALFTLSKSDPRIPALCTQAREDLTKAVLAVGGQHTPEGSDPDGGTK